MSMQELDIDPVPLDIIVKIDGDRVIAELDVSNNDTARVGDQYTVARTDRSITILRIVKFMSAEEYSNTIARRADAMREGVVGIPQTRTSRKAYQVKLAELRIEGELRPDGTRIAGAVRVPDVMVPIRPITDDSLEQFVTDSDGNVILGNLRSGSRILERIARVSQNFAGERMVVYGMPGKGKTQLVRALISQAMSQSEESDNNLGGNNDD